VKTNTAAVNTERTYEGGLARTPAAPLQLERQVATCLLFEDTFYAKGATIADEIAATCKRVEVGEIARLAIKAREDFKLRHVPLFLVAQLDLRRAESPGLVSATVERVIQRADEIPELLSIIEKVNAKPLKKVLSAQVKKGLAKAFRKFGAYALAKYNRDGKIKLRDALFLCHAKPKDDEQAAVWKRLVDGTLESPDTWEVALSAGSDKKATWERLLTEKKLGYMALLMNLRNMTEANVDGTLVEAALRDGAPGSRALPFRFVSAYKSAPAYAQAISDAMLSAIDKTQTLPGMTYIVIDVSGSMDAPLSAKGTLVRLEAASALAALLRELGSTRVFTFSQNLVEVHNVRGLPMIAGVANSQEHGGTYLADALKTLFFRMPNPTRVIVVTDEQTHDGITPPPQGVRGYLVNVAPYVPGLELGRWTRVNGFSERIVDFVRWAEASEAQ